MDAVILAGGYGRRLRPYTESKPKAMLPLDDMPMLEIILRQLVRAGCREITLALAWMAEAIEGHFADGAWLDAQLRYSVCDTMLGTAGPLSLIEPPAGACLVLNADILTSVDFRDVIDFHLDAENAATVVTRRQPIDMQFGVLDVSEDGRVTRIREKPSLSVCVSAGVYVVQPSVWELLGEGEIDMPILLEKLIEMGWPVGCYAMSPDTSWIDIGSPRQYLQAANEFRVNRARYVAEVAPPQAGQALDISGPAVPSLTSGGR